MINKKHPFIQIAAVCSILAPLVLLAGDLLLLTGADLRFEWTIALWLAFVLFVPAVFGLTFVLYNNGESRRLALAGGASAFFGAMAGASMQVLFRVYAVLAESGEAAGAQSIELLHDTLKLIATTQMIGIFFPLGLILLAVSLYRSGLFNPLISWLFVLGAVSFPVGRIGGSAVAVIGSGVFLVAAFGSAGWQILRWREETAARLAQTDFAEAG